MVELTQNLEEQSKKAADLEVEKLSREQKIRDLESRIENVKESRARTSVKFSLEADKAKEEKRRTREENPALMKS